MLLKREPLVEGQKIVKNEKKDEVKNEESQPPTISREEQVRRLRENNANDLADELSNDEDEYELCSKCKKNPSRNCRECWCRVILREIKNFRQINCKK